MYAQFRPIFILFTFTTSFIMSVTAKRRESKHSVRWERVSAKYPDARVRHRAPGHFGTEVRAPGPACIWEAMGCAAPSRILPHPSQVAKDRKAEAAFKRQLAKARAAQAVKLEL